MTDAGSLGAVPKHVATGKTPTSAASDQSSDDAEMKAAKAASLEQMKVHSSDDEDVRAAKAASMAQMDVDASSTIAEADRPAADVAAGSGGSDVLPTPRTRTAEAVARMTLEPRQPWPDQGA